MTKIQIVFALFALILLYGIVGRMDEEDEARMSRALRHTEIQHACAVAPAPAAPPSGVATTSVRLTAARDRDEQP